MILLIDMLYVFLFLVKKEKLKSETKKIKHEKKRTLNFFSNEIFKQV
jgi:hypothetical protein